MWFLQSYYVALWLSTEFDSVILEFRQNNVRKKGLLNTQEGRRMNKGDSIANLILFFLLFAPYRVRCSIKAVSNAIVDYVNESKPLDDGINGSTSPRRFVWLESSFVGTKPIDSPGTPDTPTVIMTSASRQLAGTESGSSSSIGGGSSTTGRPRNVFRFEDDHHHHHHPSSMSRTGGGSAAGTAAAASAVSPLSHDSTLTSSSAKNNGTSTTNSSTYNPYHSRNGEYLLT